MTSRIRSLLPLCVLCTFLIQASPTVAKTSHAGWPPIDGVLLINKNDSSRPLDARPGHDPFGGQDSNYSCDTVHVRGACQERLDGNGSTRVIPSRPAHNELLGGHGNDTIYAGPWGDVIWGDYKPSGQPTSQRDLLYGGAGRDFIYASHGWNLIRGGGGNDWIKAHYGRGIIDCGGGVDLLYVSHHAQGGYRIRGCERISHRTLGY